ncbi:MAG: hypothetical protein H7Y17_10415 [Chlorobia bacterium]|nr:hypothetical protein [Fimbriimonadaceae bacterium]
MQAPPLPPQKSNNVVLWVVLGVVAVCGCGGVVVLAAILFPVFSQAKLAAKQSQSLSNVKQSSLAAIMYASDYDEKMPPAEKWIDLTEVYARNPAIYHSPASEGPPNERYGYAFRAELSRKDTKKILDPQRWAMIFDSTKTGRNAVGGLDTLPSPPRFSGASSSGKNTVGFLDGHAKMIPLNGDLGATGSD